MKTTTLLLAALLLLPAPARPQAWSPDAAPGKYRNPIIFQDFSDPDVIRVGDDFYLTASSFDQVPGLPILHSRDLVHWTIVNYALPRLDTAFDRPQHGNGVWAPSLRYHEGAFWIYYGDPDRGIYLVKTRDIRGRWDPPVLVKAARGWIDPAPFWDEDGNAYLVHAYARSRSGIKHRLDVVRLSPDGTRLLDEGTRVFEDSVRHPTLEGPKLYKRNGWYYIFAPAGGVQPGWQVVLRSRHVLGPYEARVVLAQGSTPINGPHQGGYLETPDGAGWFVHFQDRGPWGRVVLLEPVAWHDDWPVLGADADGDGSGEPVLEHELPRVRGGGAAAPRAPTDDRGGRATSPPTVWAVPPAFRARGPLPRTTDDFSAPRLGLQWQWSANPRPEWYSLSARPGQLRLFLQPVPDSGANLASAPNLLLQKLPGPAFQAVARARLQASAEGGRAGLLVMGIDYAALALRRTSSGVELVQSRALAADEGAREQVLERVRLTADSALLRVTVTEQARARFWYSEDGRHFRPVGQPFPVREGRWIGAKVGLFASGPGGGHADVDFFRVSPLAAPDLVVAQDGSGDFTTIQAAVDAVRDYTPMRRTIFIRNGVYREKLLIPAWKTGITLVGESVAGTIVDFDDHAGKGDINTFTSYTARISGNDIHVSNVTFRNSAGPVGQALALFVDGDRVAFENCRFLGNQDTIFLAGEGARQYFRKVYVEGTTDFIFGPATAYFDDCEIHSRADSYVTAASTPRGTPHGFVFRGCRLTAEPGVTRVYLGRPWRDYARTVFLDSWLGAHVRPEGWHDWSRPESHASVLYAEHASRGPGAAPAARVPWARQLTAAQAARYTPRAVLCREGCGPVPWFEEEPAASERP